MPTGAQEAGKVRLERRHGKSKVSASSECSRVHPLPGARSCLALISTFTPALSALVPPPHPGPGARSCLALISTSAPARSALLPPPHPGPGARSCLALIATSGEGCVQPCPASSTAQVPTWKCTVKIAPLAFGNMNSTCSIIVNSRSSQLSALLHAAARWRFLAAGSRADPHTPT